MKIHCTLLVLGVLNANAFSLQAPKLKSSVSLQSSLQEYGVERRLATPSSRYPNDFPENSSFFPKVTTADSAAMQRASEQTASSSGEVRLAKDVLATERPITVQGGTLKTWSFSDYTVNRVQILMKSEGRPLNAEVDLWHGPDNTPQKMKVYLEDGSKRPFNAIVETPRSPNSIAIRNTEPMEFPLEACVTEVVDVDGKKLPAASETQFSGRLETIQGGAVMTYSFPPNVASVRIFMTTEGRPLNARVEMIQGPNNNKQVIDLYSENGTERPFFAIVETPGSSNVVRIVNTAPVEYPLSAVVETHLLGESGADDFVVSDGLQRFSVF